MAATRIFIAYPAQPPAIGESIERAKQLAADIPAFKVNTWRREDLGGQPVIAPIIQEIDASDVFVGDVSVLNFNVTYELGFALGRGKRVLPVRNSAVAASGPSILEVGIFDTLLFQPYDNSEQLSAMCFAADPGRRLATNYPFNPLPLYMVLPEIKSDQVSHLQARARKAGLRARTFDPAEQSRLAAEEAVRAVASSYGVVLPLLSPDMTGAAVHNIRVAFVAGIAHALSRPTLLIQHGNWPVPLDVRDAVTPYQTESQFAPLFQDFAAQVHDAVFSIPAKHTGKANTLAALNLGDPAAENEVSQLGEYFLERDEYRQVIAGQANTVIGRKGSGKTAVFVQAAEDLRAHRANVVLDLNPDSYQLRKLKDLVLDCLAAGSKEYLLTAFWEYVLLLEICSKMIEKDREVHKRDHTLFEPYQRLLAAFTRETDMEGVDFSDRLSRLIERLADRYASTFGSGKNVTLAEGQITKLLYETTLADLRKTVEDYTKNKAGVFVLFDNLDKAWNATGLEKTDIVIVRALFDAGRKLERTFRRHNIDFHCIVFLRNDIHELLVSQTPDRGKETKVLVDWMQPELLKQMLRRRLSFNSLDKTLSVEQLWSGVCVPLIKGESTLDYLIARSLMRPRYLLRLINQCKGVATNFERTRIDEMDIEKGESAYSTDVITDIDHEIRDVLPAAADVLYCFVDETREMTQSKVKRLVATKIPNPVDANGVFALLLWHGVLGLKRPSGEATFIYDVNYDLKRMQAAIEKLGEDPIFLVNPAFWAGLEMT